MDELRMSRRWLVGAGAVGTLGMMLAPDAVLAEENDRDQVDKLRWDLVQVVNGVVVAGGTDVGRTASTGPTYLTISITGSGQANPRRQKATGGGTFIIRNASGIEPPQLGHGIYYVTGFKSFVNGGGTLAGSTVVTMDTIGDIKRTTGGVLTLNVHVIAVTGEQGDAVLEIHCALPGGQSDTEGIRLALGPRQWNQDPQTPGFTLFHVLED
jgi:hypothetical protein